MNHLSIRQGSDPLTTIKEETPMELQTGGLLGIVILVLDILAILKVIQSGMPILNKALWIAIILILPVIGLILWYLIGSR